MSNRTRIEHQKKPFLEQWGWRLVTSGWLLGLVFVRMAIREAPLLVRGPGIWITGLGLLLATSGMALVVVSSLWRKPFHPWALLWLFLLGVLGYTSAMYVAVIFLELPFYG